MYDMGQTRPGSSSSIITDPDNYDWNAYRIKTIPESESDPADNNPYRSTFNPTMDTDVPTDGFRPAPTPNLKPKPNVLPDPVDPVLGETMDEIVMRLSNEFSPIVERNADTLVYLGIPPQEPGQNLFDYDHIKNHFARPYLMRSETLRRVNSSKFEKFFGPMSARTERRLKKLQVHKLVRSVDHIKYYIDLSPIINDEEAMTQLAEMSVPKDALKWHQLARNYAIPATHVGGRDTLNVPTKPYLAPSKISDQGSDDEESDAEEKTSENWFKSKRTVFTHVNLSELPLEEEYTSLRHHTTTSRLLHAIAGNDPKLNSAAKVWSFCMLAKYFDCAHSHIISPWVEGWLLLGPNTHFIQVNPYVAYRMATAMQSVWLVRCTFAILVGKRAMELAMSSDHPPSRQGLTNGACFDDLDDDEKNRVDHAAAGLHQRVKHTFQQLMLGMWMSDSDSIKHLNNLKVDQEIPKQMLERIRTDFLHYVQRRICAASTAPATSELSDDGIFIFTLGDDIRTYNELPVRLRVLTQNFWKSLRARDISHDVNVEHKPLRAIVAQINDTGLMESTLELPWASKFELINRMYEFNHLRYPQGYHFSNKTSPPKVEEIVEEIVTASPTKARKLATHGSPSTSIQSPLDPLRAWEYENEDGAKSDREQLSAIIEAAKAAALASPGSPTRVLSSVGPEGVYSASGDLLSWSDDSSEDEFAAFSTTKKEVRITDDTEAHTIRLPFEPKPFQLSAPSFSTRKPDEVTGVDMMESLPIRPKKRTSDTAGLNERLSRAFEHQNAQAAETSAFSFPSTPTGLVHRYRSKVADIGITPPTVKNYVHADTPVQASPSPAHRSLPARGQFSENFDERNTKAYGNPLPACPCDFLFDTNNDEWQDDSTPPNPQRGILKHEESSNQPYLGPRIRQAEENLDLLYPSVIFDTLDPTFRYAVTPLIVPGYKADRTCEFDIPTTEIKTLLCLNEDEWKYLPLWAGGLDDGSGGVFNDGMEIPDAPDVEDGGFRGGAMGIIPGVGSSLGGSMAGSEFEDIATEVGISTVGKASRIATDGTATVMSLDD